MVDYVDHDVYAIFLLGECVTGVYEMDEDMKIKIPGVVSFSLFIW